MAAAYFSCSSCPFGTDFFTLLFWFPSLNSGACYWEVAGSGIEIWRIAMLPFIGFSPPPPASYDEKYKWCAYLLRVKNFKNVIINSFIGKQNLFWWVLGCYWLYTKIFFFLLLKMVGKLLGRKGNYAVLSKLEAELKHKQVTCWQCNCAASCPETRQDSI